MLDTNVPEAALGVGGLLVVAVLEGRSYEWRYLVGHVIHAESDGGLVQPCSPPTRIVLRSGNRHHVLLLAIFHLHVLAAVLGIAGNFALCRWRWQVKRVVQDEVRRNKLAHLAVHASSARYIYVPRNVGCRIVRSGKAGPGSGTRYKIHQEF